VHDVLLRNNGDGSYTDVSERAVIVAGSPYAGLGVVCGDFNADGWQDIYVANDGHPNNLWINQQDGTFRDEAFVTGCALNAQGKAEAGMGVLAADFDNDADLDFFLTHLSSETNTIYRNLGGDIGFEDATSTSGLGPPSLPYTGFGTAAFDAELDGDFDIVVGNGRVSRDAPRPGVRIPPPWDEYAEPNLFFTGDGRGKFSFACDVAKQFCDPLEITRGLATGDIDRDGDIDFVISNAQGRARVYRNDAPRKGHWLIVRAIDPRLKREAIGAQVTVTCSGSQWVSVVQAGSSYLSHGDTRLHFGLGACDSFDQIEVRWPDGLVELFRGGGVDRAMDIERGTGTQ
jgi:hypothetical protein